MMTFSQKIYWARKKLDWSQIEMAKYLEVSRKSIQLWEEGKDPHTLVQDGVYTRLKLVLKGFDEPR